MRPPTPRRSTRRSGRMPRRETSGAMPIVVPTSRALIMRIVGLCALWWLSGGVLFAADRVDYARGVKPIFTARCLACHGALQQKNGLRLDTVDFMKKGGDNGPSLVPGSSAKSLLVNHITGTGGARRMP